MATLEIKSLETPDEVRGRTRLAKLTAVTVGLAVFEPGWRWSVHSKPVFGGESCTTAYVGYVISGRLRILMDDGTEGEIQKGAAFSIPPATMRGLSATNHARSLSSFLRSVPMARVNARCLKYGLCLTSRHVGF